MKDKIVCFAGHRYEWQNLNIKEKLKQTIISLIEKQYTTFYVNDLGYFDRLCSEIVVGLKKEYSNIKIYKILTYYHHNKTKWQLPPCFDGSILPEIDTCYPKLIIIKKNEWLVKNSDILVCHIVDKYKSGAYRIVKYAQRINKPIIFI